MRYGPSLVLSCFVIADLIRSSQANVVGFANISWKDGSWKTEVNDFPEDDQQNTSTDTATRVLNGNPIKIDDAPYMATLHLVRTGGNFIFCCSAHLIASDIVVTAAHCVLPGLKYAICAGSDDARQPGSCATVIGIKKHPNHSFLDLGSPDIAVLYLSQDLVGEGIKPIDVMFSPPRKNSGIITGFSDNESDEQFLLRKIWSKIIPNPQDCGFLKSFEWLIPGIADKEHLFCTAGEKTDRNGEKLMVSTCFEDSGAPLVYETPNRVLSIGVAGLSACEGGPDQESVYVKFSAPVIKDFLLPIVQEIWKRNNPPLPDCSEEEPAQKWFRFKGIGVSEFGLTTLENKIVPTKFQLQPPSPRIGGRGRTSVAFHYDSFQGSPKLVLSMIHGPPQDMNGMSVASAFMSMKIFGITPQMRASLVGRGHTITRLPRENAVRVAWRWREGEYAGIHFVIQTHDFESCMRFEVEQINRPTEIRTTSDANYFRRAGYQMEPGYIFTVCPWQGCTAA